MRIRDMQSTTVGLKKFSHSEMQDWEKPTIRRRRSVSHLGRRLSRP